MKRKWTGAGSQRLQALLAPPVTTDLLQTYLDENQLLLEAASDNMNSKKLDHSVAFLMRLQQNLLYLAAMADMQPSSPEGPPEETSSQPAASPS